VSVDMRKCSLNCILHAPLCLLLSLRVCVCARKYVSVTFCTAMHIFLTLFLSFYVFIYIYVCSTTLLLQIVVMYTSKLSNGRNYKHAGLPDGIKKELRKVGMRVCVCDMHA
jgi:hypothetical protein